MITIESTVNEGRLRITCSGVFGVGAEGNLSGRILGDAIKRLMDGEAEPPSEVVIDFTDVEYEWGDGPAWSVLPWAVKGLTVTYLARGRAAMGLQDLFSEARLDRCLSIAVVQIAQP